MNSNTVSASGFTKYYCNVTTTGSPTIDIGTSGTTSLIFYVDGVQLTASASALPYNVGQIQLRGVISSPAVFQSVSNSTEAFQIQNSAGSSNLFMADTLDNQLNIGGYINLTQATNIIEAPASDVIDVGSTASINTINVGNIAGAIINEGNNVTTGQVNVGTAVTSGTISIGTGAMTGNFNIDTGSGGNALVIGNTTPATTVKIQGGNTGTALSLLAAANGTILVGSTTATNTIDVGNSAADIVNEGSGVTTGQINIGAAVTSGTLTVGGTSTATLTVGQATATNTLDLGTGSGATSVFIGSGGGANPIIVGNTNTSSTITLKTGVTSESLTNTGDIIRNTTGVATTFEVQNAAGTAAVLTADTNNNQVLFGNVGASGINGKIVFNTATASNYAISLNALGTTGASYTLNLPIAAATTGQCLQAGTVSLPNVPLQWVSCGSHSKQVILTPEYAGAVIYNPIANTNDVGTMTTGYIASGTGAKPENYYQWTSILTTAQTYEIVVQIPLPSDFTTTTQPTLSIDVDSSNTSNATMTSTLISSNGTADATWGTCNENPAGANTWTIKSTCAVTASTNNAANGTMTLTLIPSADNSANMQIGNIYFSYTSAY